MSTPTELQPIAIYCRVSTSDQDCERQVRDLTAFAERAGYRVVGVFKETASGTKENRKIRAEVMALAQGRHIKAILVTELNRWSRSTVGLINSLEQLCSFGVSLITPQGAQFDFNTAQGRMLAGMLSVLGQFERDLLVERVKSGIETARARGKKIGRQPGQVIRPHPLTSNILEMHKSGVSIRKIAKQLSCSPTTVHKIVNRA